MITQRINLAALKSAIREMKGKNGNIECLIIPINENKLYKGQKGVYLDIVGFEIKEHTADSKDTHLLKQSLPKDVREQMSEEDLQKMPILGNMTDWDKTTQINESAELDDAAQTYDDLPFE